MASFMRTCSACIVDIIWPYNELEFPTLESQPRMIYQTFFINQKFVIKLSKNIIQSMFIIVVLG